MIEEILFSIIAFILFVYMFMYKLIKKNDTTYLIILTIQAVGIAINFIQIIFNIEQTLFVKCITYIFSIVFPIILFYIEYKGIRFYEIVTILIAKYYLLTNNEEKTKTAYIKLVTKYNDSHIGHKKLAQIYEKNNEMLKAIDEYVKILDIKKDDYNSYFKIAELLNSIDKKDESIQMLKKLVNIKPEYLEASMLLGDLLCEKEQYKEAILIYNNAIKYNPESYELYYSLGIAYTMLNDFGTAKEYYEKAAEINHKLYNAYYNMGEIALLYRELEEAEQYFIESLYENCEAKSYYQLAKIYIMKNESEKAINFINKALELDGQYVEQVKQEPIFNSIRKYIIIPKDKGVISNWFSTAKEIKVDEHLRKTFILTNRLGKQDKFINKNKEVVEKERNDND